MAQGDFTKQEAQHTTEAVNEIYEGLSRRAKGEFFGHLNDIFLFLSAAEKVAPDEPETGPQS